MTNKISNITAAIMAAFVTATALPAPALPQTTAQQTLSLGSKLDGLMRHDGTVFNQNQLVGKPTLVFFGFISCGSICPTALNTITLAAEELERRYGKDKVPHLLFMTTQPTHEGADQIASFLQHFHPDFIGISAQKGIEALLGDRTALARVQQIDGVLSQFRAMNADHHSPFAYLMDSQGRFIRLLNTQDDYSIFVRQITDALKLDQTMAVHPLP
ncbi:MAG: SCO family protein [Alphaproteobacteria bacterium]|nr:SCO family protein [Alphaproteobacteria bacterium]MCD8570299.1 SCO family protein [Alphaproteobacteria bacterium]